MEPRLNTSNQRRADIFYVARSSHKHIHYYTDDVVCHPLCDSHIVAEVTDPLSTLRKVESAKAASYAHVLDGARSAMLPPLPLAFGSLPTILAPSPVWAPWAKAPPNASTRPPATSRSVRRLLRGLLLARTDLHHRDCLGCSGSAFAASSRLPSCVAMG